LHTERGKTLNLDRFFRQVLFFIDKDFLTDAALTQTETVTLSYTFFKAGEADQSFIEGDV
jgi:cytochrome c oxidase assembly protein Cox11